MGAPSWGAVLAGAALSALFLPAAGFISSISPVRGSLAGGTVLTIVGGGLISNDTTAIRMFVGQLPCDIQWYRSNNQRVYCETQQLHGGTVTPPGYQFTYYNMLTASIVTCDSCFFQYAEDNTPLVTSWRRTVSSSSLLYFAGTLRAKFAEQYTVKIGGGRCTGLKRSGSQPVLEFGLDLYEQVISEGWDDRDEVQCYLPALEAGWHNVSLHVAHQTKSVIQSPSWGNEVDDHTQPLRGPDDGLGNAMWRARENRAFGWHPERQFVSARGERIETVLVVPQVQSVSTHVSGVLGRQQVVVTGSGFAKPDADGSCARNAVRLAGVPCAVVSCNASELRCTVAPAAAGTLAASAPFPSSFGARRRTYRSDEQTEGYLVTDDTFTSGGLYSVGSAKSEVIDAVFVAPQTAWYTFHVLARSHCDLAVGLSHDLAVGGNVTARCAQGNNNRAFEFETFDFASGAVRTDGVTAPVHMLAGGRHALRARSWGRWGAERHLKVAVRIHNPPVPPTRTESHYHAVRERQVITVDLATQDEVWEVAFSGVGADSRVHFARAMWGDDSVYNATLGRNESVRTFRVRRSDSVGIDNTTGVRGLVTSGYAGSHGCGDVTVTRTGSAAAFGQVTYTVRRGCVPRRSSGDINDLSQVLQTDELVPSAAAAGGGNGTSVGTSGGSGTPSVTIALAQRPTLRVSGYFCVGFDSVDRACINARETNTGRVRRAIESLPGVREVIVTRHGEFDTRRNVGSRVVGTYDIEFVTPQGADWPQLRLVGSSSGAPAEWTLQPNVSSGRGNLTVTVTTVRNGTARDFWYDPLPDYMLEVPVTSPEAVVVVNGVTAQCSTGRRFVSRWWDDYYASQSYAGSGYSAEHTRAHDCSFAYADAHTPVVRNSSTGLDGNLATAGGVVTVTGSGFVPAGVDVGNSTVQVRFGGAPCNVTSRTSTTITCVLAPMKTGRYHPVVIVSHVGQARVDAGASKVWYDMAVTQVTPSALGARGGTVVTVTGSGFSNIGPENQVRVGNQSCSVVTATFTELTCYAPPVPLAGLDGLCWGGADCSNATTTTAAPSSGTVHDVSWGFDVGGANVTVVAGDTVRWVFDQTPTATHNLVSGPRSAPTSDFLCPYANSGSCTHTFATAGVFEYHCTPHAGMNAVVTVMPSRRGRDRRDLPAVNASVEVRVFEFLPGNGTSSSGGAWGNWIGGVFDGYDAGTADYVTETAALDGAWAGWSADIEQVLRDTKYYGYTCAHCQNRLVISHERWGAAVGGAYARDAAPSNKTVDGAWGGWVDGAWGGWAGSGVNAVDMADGAWSQWHNGTWGGWVSAPSPVGYDWDITPSITRVSPSNMSAARTTVVTIEGNFSAFAAASGDCTASMRFVSPSGLYRECQQLAVGATNATCHLVRGKPFPVGEQRKMFPRLQLCTPAGQEVVAHPEPMCCSAAPYLGRVDIALRVEGTTPSGGSLAGGTLVTIRGAGFGPLDGRIVRSALTYNYFDEMTVVNITTDHKTLRCAVVTSNYTTVTCVTQMLNASDADPHDLEFDGGYIYTGPAGRNARVSVSVNDIAVAGCGVDPDRWTPPTPTAAAVAQGVDAISTGGGAPTSCVAVRTTGGVGEQDYRFTYVNGSVDLAAGVVFSVTAESDAHFVLSPTNASVGSQRNHEMYEVVVGMAGNARSAIRRTKFGSAQVSVATEGILRAGGRHTQLWARYASGTVTVGVGCTVGTGAFMSWTDPTPLAAQHLGFATNGVAGVWTYCEDQLDNSVGPCAASAVSGGSSGGGGGSVSTPAPVAPVYVIQYQDDASSFNCEFDYRLDRTPTISSVSPVNVTGATPLTVNGTGFASEPTVHVGPHACPVTSWSATHVTCDAPAMAAGRYYVKMHVPPFGYAAHPSDPEEAYMVSSLLSFTSVTPRSGSLMGGVTVTLSGHGFASNNTQNDVIIDGQRAHILNSTHTRIVAVTPLQRNSSVNSSIVVAVRTDRAPDGAYGQVNPHARRYASGLNHTLLVADTLVGHFGSLNAATFDNGTNAWVTPGVLYASSHVCATESDCLFVYSAPLTPSVASVSPSSGAMGTSITITGTGFTTQPNASAGTPTIDVLIGNAPCALTSVTDTAVECTVGATPAGEFRVFLTNHAVGAADGNATFTSLLTVTGVTESHGSYGGGQVITVQGAGFAGGTTRRRQRRDGAWGGWLIYDYRDSEDEAARLGTRVSICGSPCVVTSTSYSELTCTTTESFSPDRFAAFGPGKSVPLEGTVVSSGPPQAVSHGSAFDGDYETFFESEGACFTGIDLGEGEAATITKIRWFPAHQRPELMVGGSIEFSADGASWTSVHTVTESTEGWNFALVPSTHHAPVRYARFHSPAQHCALAMLEFVGVRGSANGTCPVKVMTEAPLSHPSLGPATTDDAVVHSQASGVSFSYAVADTPTVTAISPPFGSSLGGTLVTITGTGLPATVGAADVRLNDRVCNVQTASATQITCVTTPRELFRPLSVKVRAAGGFGYAVHNKSVIFRYLDRWSHLNTWLNDEPPVEGDTVVVPSDQAIIIDVPLPRLFLVLIQGFVMFDPSHDGDLNLNATYIIVYGGALQVGTADEPFLGNVAITLHGDRFKTIELPMFGSKVLAVADRGGLSTSSFANGAGHEVPDAQRGIIDIHGEPRQTVWTDLDVTAAAGQRVIRTVDPVDWRPGEKLVVTGVISRINPGEANDLGGSKPPPCMADLFPPPSETTAEEVVVDHLIDAHTVVLAEVLAHTHTSETRTTPGGAVIPMRAQVALLSRNVVVQGDDQSPGQLYGAHTIAVHGGFLRVENAEYRNCGQAANLGRYCLHFHKAGYQPPPNSYLRSNSIHHSFQRATTIHGTTHALVQNNAAYHVMGHTYFVEDGDEEYVQLEHNLGVETIVSPYSLFSDCQAATFWTATPKNIWRNNVAANSHGHGFWFELRSGAAGDLSHHPTIEVSGNTFHDNNLRGWFMAPAYIPDTPQYFRNNTYFRNQLDGVFYGIGGDTHHVGDKFASNSGTADMVWWFFPSRNTSRWIPNLKDVTFAGGEWGTGGRPRVSLFAPNQEFFLVDGAEFVNFTATVPAITQCFDCCGYRARQGAFTTRFNRMSFVDTAVRTSFVCPAKQIFFDIDGSLSGGAPGSTVTSFHAFNEWEECPRANATFSNGLVCNSSVRVRKLSIPWAATKRMQPRELAMKDVLVKKSRKVQPQGFKAVFRFVGDGARATAFERRRALQDIASFLGQDVVNVAEDHGVSTDAQLGVVVGGFHAVPTRIYSAGGTVMQAVAAHRALCVDGVITQYHTASAGGNTTMAFAFTGIAEGVFDTAPVSCTYPGELSHECRWTPAQVAATVGVTDAWVPRPGTNTPPGYYSLGARTTCAALDAYDATGFPVRLRSAAGVCSNYTTVAEVYDPIDYAAWVKYAAEEDPAFPVWGGVACAEWACATDGAVPCPVWQCVRAAATGASAGSPGSHFTGTWIRGVSSSRDADCTLFTCHRNGPTGQCLEFRCSNALNPTLCVEHFAVAQNETACAQACDANANCTSLRFYPNANNPQAQDSCRLYNIPPGLLSGNENAQSSHGERCLGKMEPEMMLSGLSCAATGPRTSLNTCKPKVPRVDEFGGISWGQYETTGRLPTAPSVWSNNTAGSEGFDNVEYGPGKQRTSGAAFGFDWEGWAVPLVTHHDYFLDFDWHVDFTQLSMRWSEPFHLQNPVVDPGVFVPSDARFAGVEDMQPVVGESVLLSFPYVDYRYRFLVDVPGYADMPWHDKTSDYCQGSNCSRPHYALGPLRGEITRHDDFGTTFVDRRDDTLVTAGFGGVWSVAVNPWSGVNVSAPCLGTGERPKPVNRSLTVTALQCSPYMCSSGQRLPLRPAMRWSDPLLWQEMSLEAATNNATAATLARGAVPVAGDAVEIPGGFHVLFDVNTYDAANVLETVVVHGKLEFVDDADRALHTRSIVNFGELEIGTEAAPFLHRAEIVLHGNRTSNTVVVSDQHFLGNKMIANFGNLTMVAQRTAMVTARLQSTAPAGAMQLTLTEPAGDWAVGDTLVVAGTSRASAPHSSDTGTYTGFRFVTLSGPDELHTESEEVTVTAVSSDSRTFTFAPALAHSHFAGSVDTGLDYEQFAVVASAGGGTVTFAARAVSQAGPNVSWAGLLGVGVVSVPSSLACSASGWPSAESGAASGSVVLVAAASACSVAQVSAVVLQHGARGLMVVDDAPLASLHDSTCAVPTMVVPGSAGSAMSGHLGAGRTLTVHPHGTAVALRTAVGNTARRIVIRGEVAPACTQSQHEENLAHYQSNCAESGDAFFTCARDHGLPHACYWMKGYGAHMLTGEWNYGSEDQFRRFPTNTSLLGQVRAFGVEFRNFGKLATDHRGFVINYWNDWPEGTVSNAVVDSVFKNSWYDAVVVGAAPAMALTGNIVHRTLGLGITTGDPLPGVAYTGVWPVGPGVSSGGGGGWGGGGRRRRTMSAALADFNRVAPGGNHTVVGNLVTASFEYPYARVDAHQHYMWHSGMLLRQAMAAMRGNVVSGAEHGGMTFATQSQPDQQGAHDILDNEAVGCRYGAIARNPTRTVGHAHHGGRAQGGELFRFTAWSNEHAGVVAFDTGADLQLREVTLSDNYYGAVVSFVAGGVGLTVRNSTVVGQSAASAHLPSLCHVRAGLAVPIYTQEPGPRCATAFGGCKTCSVEGRAMGERFGNSASGRTEKFYVESTRFAHFGQCGSRGIHYAETSPDYSPDIWLTRLQWHPETVSPFHRVRLGDTWGTHAGCGSGESCDAVNYVALHDTDGSTVGTFWAEGRDTNLRNTTFYSDNNPAVANEANCRADPRTRSIACENFPLTTVGVDIPPLCNDGCPAVSHVTVTRYAPAANRSYFSVGAFEQGCSCQEHFLGGSFPAVLGLTYDVDMPVVNDLNLGDSTLVDDPATELLPMWIPPNTRFEVHSRDPTDCVLLRLYMQRAAPVTVIMNGNNVMDHARLDDGTLPTPTSPRGTHALHPQQRRLYLTVCGGAWGTGTYVLRVEERVQVSLTVEMSFNDFFAESVPPEDTAAGTVELYERTTGLEQLVFNMATMLGIPQSRIKVACVHPAGEPCIPLELMLATGGANVGGRRRRMRRGQWPSARAARSADGGGDGDAPVADPATIEFNISAPNPVNATGDQAVYDANIAFFDGVVHTMGNLSTNTTLQTELIDAVNTSIAESNRSADRGGVTATIAPGGIGVKALHGNNAGNASIGYTVISAPLIDGTTTTPTTTTTAGPGSGDPIVEFFSDTTVVASTAAAAALVAALVAAVLVKRSKSRIKGKTQPTMVPSPDPLWSPTSPTWQLDSKHHCPLPPSRLVDECGQGGTAVAVRDSLLYEAGVGLTTGGVYEPGHLSARRALTTQTQASAGHEDLPPLKRPPSWIERLSVDVSTAQPPEPVEAAVVDLPGGGRRVRMQAGSVSPPRRGSLGGGRETSLPGMPDADSKDAPLETLPANSPVEDTLV